MWPIESYEVSSRLVFVISKPKHCCTLLYNGRSLSGFVFFCNPIFLSKSIVRHFVQWPPYRMGGQSKNSGGAVAVRARRDHFEVVVGMYKRVRSTETVAAWICNWTSNTINSFKHFRPCLRPMVQCVTRSGRVLRGLAQRRARLFCCGAGTIYTDTTQVRKTMSTRDEN
jgi:hypothetical protein